MYVLFLAKLQVDTIEGVVIGMDVSNDKISWLVNTWIIAGLLSIIPVTSTLASLSVIVQDREKKIMMDFKSMPMKSYKYPLSVIISSTTVGVIMGFLGFITYILIMGIESGKIFSINQCISTFILIFITALMSSTIMGWLALFFKTSSGFTSLNIVVGTIIGFVNAVYVPIGVLPSYVQGISKIFPTAHVAVLFRNVLMSDALSATFSKAVTEAKEYYLKLYGINFYNGKNEVFSHTLSILYIVALTVIGFILFIVFYNRKKEEY